MKKKPVNTQRLYYRFIALAYQKNLEDELETVRCEGCNKLKYRYEIWSDQNGGNVRTICSEKCLQKAVKKNPPTRVDNAEN